MFFLLLLNYTNVLRAGFWLLVVHQPLALVEVFDDRGEVLQVLSDHGKLLNREFLSIVVVVEMVGFDLLELLLFVRLLHIDGVVVETRDVLWCVDDLARLKAVKGLCSALSVLTELLQVVNRHQNPRQLRYFTELLAWSLLLSVFKLALLVVDILWCRFKVTDLVVEQHDGFVHILLVSWEIEPLVAEFCLFLLKFAVKLGLGVLQSSVATEYVGNLSVLIRVLGANFLKEILVLFNSVPLLFNSLGFLS